MRKKIGFAVVVIVTAAATFAAQQHLVVNNPLAQIGLHDVGHVESVIDGRTLVISYHDGKDTFIGRLANVIAPALVDPGGPQAQQSLDQLANGRTIAFIIESSDKDGTPRLAVELDGINVAIEQLHRGWVRLQRPADHNMVDAELVGRREHVGMWANTLAIN